MRTRFIGTSLRAAKRLFGDGSSRAGTQPAFGCLSVLTRFATKPKSVADTLEVLRRNRGAACPRNSGRQQSKGTGQRARVFNLFHGIGDSRVEIPCSGPFTTTQQNSFPVGGFARNTLPRRSHPMARVSRGAPNTLVLENGQRHAAKGTPT